MRWRPKKKEALNTFETVTKNILQDEIEHGHREKIAELEHEYEDVKRQLQLTTAEVKARRPYTHEPVWKSSGQRISGSVQTAGFK